MKNKTKRRLSGKISRVDIRIHNLGGNEFKLKNEPLEKGIGKFMNIAEELFQLDLDKLKNEARKQNKFK